MYGQVQNRFNQTHYLTFGPYTLTKKEAAKKRLLISV